MAPNTTAPTAAMLIPAFAPAERLLVCVVKLFTFGDVDGADEEAKGSVDDVSDMELTEEMVGEEETDEDEVVEGEADGEVLLDPQVPNWL
jgi:hypothetical protein